MTTLLAPGGADAVAVVLVGDELLLGSVNDSNGGWLARAVTESGLRLVHVAVVPDEVSRISGVVASLVSWVGSVVVSGGIGPTSDDLTRQALAEVAGCDLVVDPEAEAAIHRWLLGRGRAPGREMMRMALRPANASMLVNPSGSAPGVRLPVGDCVVYAVPGVPAELQAMSEQSVLPDMLARVAGLQPLLSVSVEVALLGESSVARLLRDVEAAIAGEPTVDLAYLARPAHVSVRVSVRDSDEARAAQALSDWEGKVRRALGRHVVGRNGTTLAEAVVSTLTRSGQTVSVAESLTGGAVTAALTAVPGASAVVRGGVTAYSTDLKHVLLAVPERLLAERGPVDAGVAASMAEGVRTRLGSDWGVATTGVAGPDPVGTHAPGEVYVCVAGAGATTTRPLSLPGSRERVQLLATAHALDELRVRLWHGE